MRRALLVVALALTGLVSPSSGELAAQEGRAVCEGYCGTVAVGCYIFVGLFFGKDKCDAMYEGCVDGCVAALLEEE